MTNRLTHIRGNSGEERKEIEKIEEERERNEEREREGEKERESK